MSDETLPGQTSMFDAPESRAPSEQRDPMARLPRSQLTPLYYVRSARTPGVGKQRHRFPARGDGYSSVCGRVGGGGDDDPALPDCKRCVGRALLEIALALDAMGYRDAAVKTASLGRAALVEAESEAGDDR